MTMNSDVIFIVEGEGGEFWCHSYKVQPSVFLGHVKIRALFGLGSTDMFPPNISYFSLWVQAEFLTYQRCQLFCCRKSIWVEM
jgi:hypothetical protein